MQREEYVILLDRGVRSVVEGPVIASVEEKELYGEAIHSRWRVGAS